MRDCGMHQVLRAFVIFTLGFAAAPSAADELPSVLMMDLKATYVDAKTVGLVQNLVSSELAQQKGFELITGADLRKMLALQSERQAMGCNAEDSCLSEIAGAMGARYVIYGEMGKLGSFYLLSLNLFDSQESKSTARASIKGKSIDDAVNQIADLVQKVIDETRDKGGLSVSEKRLKRTSSKKPMVFMRDAAINKNRLKGYAYEHPKLGEGYLTSSKVLAVTYDERGTANVETRNTLYVVGPTGWKQRPAAHPLNKSQPNDDAPKHPFGRQRINGTWSMGEAVKCD